MYYFCRKLKKKNSPITQRGCRYIVIKKRISLVAALSLVLGMLFAPLAMAGENNTLYGADMHRYWGADRFKTALDISRKNWSPKNVKQVYIANGMSTADALVAGTLTKGIGAGQLTGGPILLTKGSVVDSAVVAEIKRLGNPEVVVIGGTGVVVDKVARGYNGGKAPKRLYGDSRFSTSVAVSKAAFPGKSKKVYVTSGMNVPDGVVGAALTDGPILLVNPKTGPTQAVLDEIARLGATSIVKLGSTNLGMKTTGEIGGASRYQTAVNVAKAADAINGKKPLTVYLARGDVYADAIAAGSVTWNGPIVLVQSRAMPAEVCNYLKDSRPDRVIALGGGPSVHDQIIGAAANCANGGTDVKVLAKNTCPAGQEPNGGASVNPSTGKVAVSCGPIPTTSNFDSVNDIVFSGMCPGSMGNTTYRKSKNWTRPAAIKHFNEVACAKKKAMEADIQILDTPVPIESDDPVAPEVETIPAPEPTDVPETEAPVDPTPTPMPEVTEPGSLPNPVSSPVVDEADAVETE